MTGATIAREPHGWRVSIPLRCEDVTVRKQVLIVEEVDIRRELDEEDETISLVAPTEQLHSPSAG